MEFGVPLEDGPAEFRGALDLERTPAGLRPRRLPAWTRPRMPGAFCAMVVAQPSGVRLAFATGAIAVSLEALITRTVFLDAPRGLPDPPGVGPGDVFEVVVDGVPFQRVPAPAGGELVLDASGAEAARTPGRPGTVRVGPLPPGPKQVEVWFPQGVQVEVVSLRADGPVTAPEPSGRPVWLHHGSSISHCAEADGPLGTWPVVAARSAGVEVVNLGFAGNAMLDPFTARAVRDAPADLISLKLGINLVNGDAMRLRAFEPAVHGFLDTVRDGHPDTPLLVISPIACPIVEDRPGPTSPHHGPDGTRFRAHGDPAGTAQGALTLRTIRDVLGRIVAERSPADPRLHYLDGRALFGGDDVRDLPDDLHPNAAGYRRMGERFAALAFAPDGPFAAAAGHPAPRP